MPTKKKEHSMQNRFVLIALFLTFGTCFSAWAGSFNAGVGLGFADSRQTEGFDGGWDLQFGYEMNTTQHWDFGAQFHLIRGWTTKGDVNEEKAYGYEDSTVMAFNSEALYLTARPKNWWILFKAGLVHADYHTVTKDVSDTGLALGVGIVLGSDLLRLHLIDYHRYIIGSEHFDIYTIAIGFVWLP
jgi:hypothetical protein